MCIPYIAGWKELGTIALGHYVPIKTLPFPTASMPPDAKMPPEFGGVPNSGGILGQVAEHKTAVCLVARAKK